MSYLGVGVTQGIVDLDSFAGNGSTAAFTLARAPSSSESLLVVTDGVVQDPGEWTISGATLTFTTAPHSGADIRVWNLSSSAQDATDPSSTIETLSGVNGSQLTFTLSNSAASQDQVLVFVDGVMQNDSKYSVDGTALVFGSGNAPPNGSILDVFTITSGGFTATVPGDNTVTLAKMADDAVGVAELSATGTASSSTFLRGDNAWAAAGGGKVLQVVNAVYSTQTTSTSDSYVDTGLTAAITTASSSNKVLVIVQQRGCGKAADTGINLQLLRAASSICVFEARGGYTGSSTNNGIGACGVVYLDSPGSAAEHTYHTEMASYSDINTAYAQWVGGTAKSSIALIELEY